MAVVATIVKKSVRGDRRVHRGTATLGTYAAGGAPYTPATFGLSKLNRLDITHVAYEGAPAAATTRLLGVDTANSKIVATDAATPTELSAATHDTLVFVWEAEGT